MSDDLVCITYYKIILISVCVDDEVKLKNLFASNTPICVKMTLLLYL